jgi:hypothetical protein
MDRPRLEKQQTVHANDTYAELGSTDALTAGRPGSWEADLVQLLAKGTVGWDGEYLGDA